LFLLSAGVSRAERDGDARGCEKPPHNSSCPAATAGKSLGRHFPGLVGNDFSQPSTWMDYGQHDGVSDRVQQFLS
jgi:hypothetical protein